MRRTKRALVVMAFALVSCSAPTPPASTPTSDSVTLRLYATTATIPLLNDLTAGYHDLHFNVTFEIISGNYQTMMEQLMSEKNGYLVTSHLAENSGDGLLAVWPHLFLCVWGCHLIHTNYFLYFTLVLCDYL